MFYSSSTINVGAVSITDTGTGTIKEAASYTRDGIGVSFGIAHRVFINWTHFHRYSPSFYQYNNATALANDTIRASVDRGWQFRSELTNGIGFDNRNNVFNPTSGLNSYLSISQVGQYLGGSSNFDRFSPVFEFYHSWFDYTLGGLFRSNALRRWKVVQEFRTSWVMTFERPPKYGRPERGGLFNEDEAQKQRNPYIQPQDMQFLGGYESLRGWNFQDPLYPQEWRNGANHRALFNTELRFPIEPTLLWLVVFLDAGHLYEEVEKWTGTRREEARTYDQTILNIKATQSWQEVYIREHYNLSSLKPLSPDQNPYTKNDPDLLYLKPGNVSLNSMKYSWGIGIRVQIPVLPLRLYFAQRLYHEPGDAFHPLGSFRPYTESPNFQFVFGIGDFRF
jgi:outer membrane protein insertion porin family